MKRGAKFFRVAYFAALLFAFAQPLAVLAATEYVAPASASYKAPFSVGVYVGTDAAVNAVSGTISYPSDLLRLTSVSKNGSIISLWASEPTFSNDTGTVNFEGVILNPGYTGTSGRVVTLNFTPLASGTATVSVTGGSILANDGNGTDVLTGRGSATYTLTVGEAPVEKPPAEPGVPGLPAISSSTHPDASAWYSLKNPTLAWPLPAGVTDINILADHSPSSDPGTTSDGLRSSYSYTNVDDGEWFVHLKFKNALGWGPTAHRRFKIDSVAPSVPVVTFEPGTETEWPRLLIVSTDALSGLDHYRLAIDDAPEIDWIDDGTHAMPLTSITVGDHKIKVVAFDKAGNSASVEQTFAVSTIPLAPPPVTVIEEPAPVPASTFSAVLAGVNIKLVAIVASIVLALALLAILVIVLIQRFEIKVVRKPVPDRRYKRSDKAFRRAFSVLRKETQKYSKKYSAADRKRLEAHLDNLVAAWDNELAGLRKLKK